MVETKMCPDCGETKPLTEFHKHPKTSDGANSYCKLCVNRRSAEWKKKNPEKRALVEKKARIKRCYGLTIPQYHAFFWSVNHQCLCGEVADHLDHCHETGKVRRALCSSCNLAIGHMNDDPRTAKLLTGYLEAHAA